ncbi:alpha/beta-hydrolase [Gloeophyllum trabeum ATCC 11539]|uniref:Alpha/beta-hydrolase n=1 Tax=Gloeophyllum trabeum (strain ATCC 11539 / FP-39264 / Madison 617) TaxID=670483 RepID=S7PWI6_GLOTA|nr:alpha/beta-hydrolase [Gloeophyllum trabeum ATCC 11539]EPQ51722.1 alpha/beta-hydrolase [Gloeophyllum trabeum ATCC 11539]
MIGLCVALGAVLASVVQAQEQYPNGVGYPHNYTGIPSGDYSPEWQDYFQVTEQPPNVTWTLGRNWAGNIGVQRAGHPNNTLFFWAFEKTNGSLTAAAGENSDVPWGIWLNGGPGSSSLIGLLIENGPIHIANDYSAYANNYSWDTLADYVWIDQPVGTGYSTVDYGAWVADEDQMGVDFFGFLENLVKVFPSLATRPLYLTGESYCGTYIPYITKTYFNMENPPVKLAKIAIGDGTIGSGVVFELLPTVTTIETYPQLIGYDPEVYQYFKEQEHLCGYDLNLTYPQNGHFPTLNYTQGAYEGSPMRTKSGRLGRQSLLEVVKERYAASESKSLHKRDRELRRELWKMEKRDLSGRANGTIDSWYGCDIYDELLDYAVNFTFPWSAGKDFDVYDIPDALSPEAPQDGSVFLNDNRTRAAIHAPTSKDWVESIYYNFTGGQDGNDPSVEPMAFLTDLATNATAKNVSVVIYSGNDDSLVAHRGSEVVIQNTTFGGIQGFTRKPSTPWYDDAGNFAGIAHQERNWSYILFKGAGHLVAAQQPELAYVFLREFVLGNNHTGLVESGSNVVGGEVASLAGDYYPGGSEIYYGSGTTQSTYVAPSATIAAWESFIQTADPITTAAGAAKTAAKQNSAARVGVALGSLGVGVVFTIALLR